MLTLPAPPSPKSSLVVLDTCFDDGKRFLAYWKATSGSLHYLAYVGSPHSENHWQAPTMIEGSSEEARELQAAWPVAIAGFHCLALSHGRIRLTLMFGTLDGCLEQCVARVDRFLIDPNAAIYCARRLAQLAAPSARLLMTAPGSSDALQRAGFTFQSVTEAIFSRRRRSDEPRFTADRHAVVVGAGLAGSAVCERLCRSGWRVTLIEQHAEPAQETSGNHAGILLPQLSKDDNVSSRLVRAAYLFAQRHWSVESAAVNGARCGVLQLARDALHASQQSALAEQWKFPPAFARWLDADQASRRLGSVVPHGGWWFPQGGWIDPAALCRAWLAACGERLTAYFGRRVGKLVRDGNRWQIMDGDGALLETAPVVVFANGNGTHTIDQLAGLPLQTVRGQVTQVAQGSLRPLSMVVCREGYLTPFAGGFCSVGASYDLLSDDPRLSAASQQQNLQRLDAMLPGYLPDDYEVPLAGRVGFRSVAPDRLPLIGALPQDDDAPRVERLREMSRMPGIYCALGYASRGLIWASLGAELLAAQLEGWPLPIERDLVEAIDPTRFLLKQRRAGS